MKVLPEKTGKKKYGDFVVVDGKMLFNRVGSVNAQYQKKNDKAPVKRGVWAFPYPLFDYFFVGSSFSMPAQHRPENDKVYPIDDKLRIAILKRLKGLKTKYNIGLSKLNPTKDNPHPTYWGDEKYEIEELEEALEKGEINGYSYSSLFRKTKYKDFNKIHRFYWGGPIYARFAPKNQSIEDWYLYKDIYSYIKELRKQLINLRTDKSFGGTGDKVYKIGVNIVGAKDYNLSVDHLEVFIPMKAT